MSKIVHKSNIKRFKKLSSEALSTALYDMSQDIILYAKIRIPFKSGDLMKSLSSKKKGQHKYRVAADTKYAAYQERGKRLDGSHVVKILNPGNRKGISERRRKEGRQ